jgi:FLYWCH zinc finger domain
VFSLSRHPKMQPRVFTASLTSLFVVSEPTLDYRTAQATLMSIINKPIKIVPGYKGRPKLLIDGYVYFRNNERNGKTYWLCSKNRSIKCVSRLITKSSEVTVKNNVHNHGREYDVNAERY